MRGRRSQAEANVKKHGVGFEEALTPICGADLRRPRPLSGRVTEIIMGTLDATRYPLRRHHRPAAPPPSTRLLRRPVPRMTTRSRAATVPTLQNWRSTFCSSRLAVTNRDTSGLRREPPDRGGTAEPCARDSFHSHGVTVAAPDGPLSADRTFSPMIYNMRSEAITMTKGSASLSADCIARSRRQSRHDANRS